MCLPNLAIDSPHCADDLRMFANFCRSAICRKSTPLLGKIAAVCVEIPLVDFNVLDSTALPRCRYNQVEGIDDGDVR